MKIQNITLVLLVLGLFTFTWTASGVGYYGGFYYDTPDSNSEAEIIGYVGSDTDVVVPATLNGKKVTEIDDCAFSATWCQCDEQGNEYSWSSAKRTACANITSVTISAGVEEIACQAFQGCGNLQYVSIPASVTEIETNVFTECPSLQEIEVASGNKNYCSVGGVLFNKAKTMLIKYPASKDDSGSYTVPSGVTTIGGAAFDYANLEAVSLPATVTVVQPQAFVNTALYCIYFDGKKPTLAQVLDYRGGYLDFKTSTYVYEYSWFDSDTTLYGYKSQGWTAGTGVFGGCDVVLRNEGERITGAQILTDDTEFCGGASYDFWVGLIHGDGNTTKEANASGAVWTLSSGSSYASVSTATDGHCVLKANDTTTNRSVTLKLAYAGFTATYAVTIQPAIPKSLEIAGADTILSEGNATYTATVTYSNGATGAASTCTWSITSGSSYASVDTKGKVTAKETYTAQTVALKASYTGNGTTVTATKEITIMPKAPYVTDLEVNVDTSVVRAGYSAQLNATATYNTGTTEIVTTQAQWALVSGAKGVTLSSTGKLTVPNDLAVPCDLVVSCKYTTSGVSESDVATIAVQPAIALDSHLFTYTYTLTKGWNLISVVLDLDDGSKAKLLQFKLYDYDAEKQKSFAQTTELQAGKAYWLFAEEDTTLTVQGYPCGTVKE